jgi:hypothetical protein
LKPSFPHLPHAEVVEVVAVEEILLVEVAILAQLVKSRTCRDPWARPLCRNSQANKIVAVGLRARAVHVVAPFQLAAHDPRIVKTSRPLSASLLCLSPRNAAALIVGNSGPQKQSRVLGLLLNTPGEWPTLLSTETRALPQTRSLVHLASRVSRMLAIPFLLTDSRVQQTEVHAAVENSLGNVALGETETGRGINLNPHEKRLNPGVTVSLQATKSRDVNLEMSVVEVATVAGATTATIHLTTRLMHTQLPCLRTALNPVDLARTQRADQDKLLNPSNPRKRRTAHATTHGRNLFLLA